jgi:hypothetical protein
MSREKRIPHGYDLIAFRYLNARKRWETFVALRILLSRNFRAQSASTAAGDRNEEPGKKNELRLITIFLICSRSLSATTRRDSSAQYYETICRAV